MKPKQLAIAALFTATVSILPSLALLADTTTTTTGGVQVIDMNAPPPTPKPQQPPSKKAVQPAPPSADKLPGADALLHNALAYVGVPYRMGGTTPAAFDCSGFTQYAFATVGIRIPRTADQQFYKGRAIAGDPLPGDLVFFQTYEYGPSHVGIYIGGGQFVNAIGKDVHIASFDTPYFRGRYLGARRYLPD
jgi:cell wall-associated NlpC family hydrolase